MDWESQFFDPTTPPPPRPILHSENGREKGPNPKVVNYIHRRLLKLPVVKIADLGTACWTYKHFTGL